MLLSNTQTIFLSTHPYRQLQGAEGEGAGKSVPREAKFHHVGGGQVSWLKKESPEKLGKKHCWGASVSVKKKVWNLCLPGPLGGPAILPTLGQGMGVIASQWVTGNPPPSSFGRWWGIPRLVSY